MVVRVAVISVAKAVLRRCEDGSRKIWNFQFSPPSKVSGYEVGVKLQPLHPSIHDENIVNAVPILYNMPELVGAYCCNSQFRMLTAPHDLTIQRISEHHAAIRPAQLRPSGGKCVKPNTFRKCKTG